MRNTTLLIPKATTHNPYSEINWIFQLIQAEKKWLNVKPIRTWYIKYLDEYKQTNPNLNTDPRFFLETYWQPDALIHFTEWLNKQRTIASLSRYHIYKIVRYAMDYAYQLGIIDHIVYHAPMFKGKRETNMRAPYSEHEQEIIETAIAKWITLAERMNNPYKKTGQTIPYREHNNDPLDINGDKLSIREASKKFGVNTKTIRLRRKDGWSDKQCVGLVPAPIDETESSKAKEIVAEGIKWPSITKAAKYYKVDRKTVSDRLRSGFSPEQAVGLKPLYSMANSFDGILYDFEEQFNCDPMALFLHAKDHKKGRTTRSIRELMSFFLKIGTWPFIEKRIILPLAAELCRLTGLNAESISSLTVDSYSTNHPLTNQPYIKYTKVRAGNSNRSEDKELHIKLLESDELFIEDSIQERVSHIINLTLDLTERIRPFAKGETRNRLFIFEHNQWFKKPHTERRVTHIIWGWPTPEELRENPDLIGIGHWPRDFCKENDLYNLLGKDFNLNFSRFRPTLINNMVKQGADIFDIQAAVGHKSVLTTSAYLTGQELDSRFTEIIDPALRKVSQQNYYNNHSQNRPPQNYKTGYTETLCGTGCKDAYNPSQRVRELTGHIEGSLCKYWNMCILCEQNYLTEKSLPKLIAYKWKIQEILSNHKSNMTGRSELYSEIIAVIDEAITADHYFPEKVVKESEYLASELDDEALDHLVYQGF